MAYEKRTLVDGETPLNKDLLDHMQGGISENDKRIENLEKGSGVSTITKETELTATSGAKSYIAKKDGSLTAGGSYGSLEYDISAFTEGSISVSVGEYTVPAAGQYVDCVFWALYSGTVGTDTILAYGPDIHDGVYSATIDISQYPDAKILKVLVNKSAPNDVVKHTVTYTQFDIIDKELAELDERVDKLESASIEVNLPDELYAVKGERIQLFHRGIFEVPEPSFYDIRMFGTIGKERPRYYHADCSTVGDYSITAEIYDKDGVKLGGKTTTLHVINPMSEPSENKNVLMLGSSTLGPGTTSHELKRRLTDTSGSTGNRANPKGLGLSNITFVGRKSGSVYTDVQQEANGGWNYQQYASAGRGACRFYVSGVTQINLNDSYTDGTTTFTVSEVNVDAASGSGNIRCLSTTSPTAASGTLTLASGTGDATITYSSFERESFSPFWDYENSCIDFKDYADRYCGGKIDVIVAELSSNDTNSSIDMDVLFNSYIKPFIRKFHEQFPNGKYVLGTQPLVSTLGEIGTLGTINRYKASRRYWEFWRRAKALSKEDEFSSYVVADDGIILCDSENLYPFSMQTVTNRSTVTEPISTNGNHPSGSGGQFKIGDDESGCQSIADALYQSFNALWV